MTTVHSPFDVRIFHKECHSLARAGYRVTLLQRGDQAETRSGVRIEPLKTYNSRIARMTIGVLTALRKVLKLKPDSVHFHDVELVWAGVFLKLAGYTVIYDVHEDVAKDLDDKAYLPKWMVAVLRVLVTAVEAVAVRMFDVLVTATKAIDARFPADGSVLVRNTPILGELSHADPAPFRDRPMEVGYLGGLADFNGPDVMVDAIGLLPDDLHARLVLGGRFVEPALETRVRGALGWQRVDFRGWVDRDQIGDIFANLRCGLVLYKPTPNVVTAEPNKFFEFLSAGLPLVASDFPIWSEFVQRFRCGFTVDPSDPAAIADKIEYLLRHPDEAQAMGERGRRAIIEEYNWAQDEAVLLDTYARIVGQPPSAHGVADA